MKNIILKLAFVGLLAPIFSFAQTNETPVQTETQTLPKPYNEEEDGLEAIEKLVQKAQIEKKNIIIQAGGNWCIWCRRFDNFVKTTPELNNLVQENFIYYHLNFSPKNKNEKAFTKYSDNQKRGYPFFIVIDQNGKTIHIRESEDLEDGKGYSIDKVKIMFSSWIATNLEK